MSMSSAPRLLNPFHRVPIFILSSLDPAPSMASCADWSTLPTELLQEIASRLDSSIYIIRFRTVCSAWRAAVTPPPRLLSAHPIATTNSFAVPFGGSSLSKRIIFLLSLPPDRNPSSALCRGPKPWMVKTEEIAPAGTFHLFNPLARTHVNSFPASFPRLIDLMDVRVHELGQEYVLKFVNLVLARDYHSLYLEKVAVLSRNGLDYVVLTIHISGKLAVFRSGDDKWVIVNDMQAPYDDVIVYDGKFYGVDHTGRMVMVQVDDHGVSEANTLTLVAKPVFGGDKKFLVKSENDLLLVDMYNGMPRQEDSNEELEEDDMDIEEYNSSNTLWFEVFRFDVSEQRWVRVHRLDGRVLFLNDNCAFSASASDLYWTRDNCIWYNFTSNGNDLFQGDDDPLRCPDINVFEMDNGCTWGLHEYGDWSELFSPLPSWIK